MLAAASRTDTMRRKDNGLRHAREACEQRALSSGVRQSAAIAIDVRQTLVLIVFAWRRFRYENDPHWQRAFAVTQEIASRTQLHQHQQHAIAK